MDRLPVTTVERTLIDVASISSEDVLAGALDDALRRGLTTVARLVRRLDDLAGIGGRPGSKAMRRLLAARSQGPVPKSDLETKYLQLSHRAELPTAIRQHPVRLPNGRLAFIDFAYPDARIAIELEGDRWHSTPAQRARDRARRNALTLLGWLVLIFDWHRLRDEPDGVAEEVRRALALRPT